MSKINVRKITISAIFLSLALVTKLLFTVYLPIFGANGMKIGLTGIFSAFPAILFGPMYGGIVTALLDFLGCIIKPSGAYIPWFTVVAFIGGFLKGLVWKSIKNTNEKWLRIVVIIALIAVGILGVSNSIMLNSDGVNGSYFETAANSPEIKEDLSIISQMIITRAEATKSPQTNLDKYILYVTTALIVFSIMGILIMVMDYFINKKFDSGKNTHSTFKIFMSLLISGLVVTTINTQLLRMFVYNSWSDVAFLLLWIPRAIEEVVVCMVHSYVIAVLYNILVKYLHITSIENTAKN